VADLFTYSPCWRADKSAIYGYWESGQDHRTDKGHATIFHYMAGYSGTPLAKKLGLKDGFRIWFVNAPENFERELEIPAEVGIISSKAKPLDLILLFTKSEARLRKDFSVLAQKLSPNGMLWISWPKKASGVATDLNENLVRQIGLDAGLVDVKICAINDVWSGLKFVYRLRDRGQL
jgi:hypothetical protein